MQTNINTSHYPWPRRRRRRRLLLLLLQLLRRRRHYLLLLRRVRTKRDGVVHGRQRHTRGCGAIGHWTAIRHGVRHWYVGELAR